MDRRLGSAGLGLQLGPFAVRVTTELASLKRLMYELLKDYRVIDDDPIWDFHVRVSSTSFVRRWLRPQVQFFVDGRAPFEPLPAQHHLAVLEWGINWCIAARCHHFLMLHAAVVERNGRAMLFPAWPGHGKSTLCAGLVFSGWRLLSDEFGLVRPADGQMVSLPRLIPLKNESIEVIRRFAPGAHIGPPFAGTRKGTVAHVRPPVDSVNRADETAEPGWVVFPRWVRNSPLRLEPMPRAQAFLMVASNAFNYEVLGVTSFRLVDRLVGACACYSLTYSDLGEAVDALDRMTGENA
jgi:HprK-related kinase A